jgi:hypothetical protein
MPGASTNPAPSTPPVAGKPAQMNPVVGAAGGGAMMVMLPTAGAAGTGSQPPASTTTMPTGTTMAPMPGKLAMDECGLHTKYAGDEYCILPPPADKGFQLHIGPTNYDNPEAQYLLQAGEERTDNFAAVSGNDKQIYFYARQYRMRTGAHHNIITSGSGGDTGLGQRIGTSNNLAEDYPKGGVVAPENKGVGISMPAHTSINVSLHSINISSKQELREIWVNFWYRDASEVTEPVQELFSIAPQPSIYPGQDIVFGSSCTISGTGRMLWFYGHRHANNVRFSTWRLRGAKKDLIYEGYNWEEPMLLDYSSTVQNPVADTAQMIEGGWSGILDLMPGDTLQWECHVINKTQGTLNFSNNTYTGEMCIMDGEMIGTTCF